MSSYQYTDVDARELSDTEILDQLIELCNEHANVSAEVVALFKIGKPTIAGMAHRRRQQIGAAIDRLIHEQDRRVLYSVNL